MNAEVLKSTESAVAPQEMLGTSGARSLAALAALGQQARLAGLAIFRLLATQGPCGLTVGEAATAMQHSQDTTSGNRAFLSRAQIVTSVRQGAASRAPGH